MKRLFFSALVAIVAVSAATSTQAITFYAQGSSNPITCSTGPVSCSTLPTVNYYAEPASPGPQSTAVARSQFQSLFKAN